MALLVIFLLVSWLRLSAAHELKDDEICVSSCQQALSGLIFTGTDPDADYYVSRCTNDLRVTSIFVCSRKYCPPSDINPGVRYLNQSCKTDGSVSMLPYSVIGNFTDAEIDNFRHIELVDAKSQDPIDEVVLPARELFDMAFVTLSTWKYEAITQVLYGWSLYWFWTIVISIGLFGRLLSYIASLLRIKSEPDKERGSPLSYDARLSKIDQINSLIQRRFILPETFSSSLSKSSWYTVPRRIQSLAIAAFIVINTVLCSVNYRLFAGNMYWSETNHQLWRYLSNRAGVLALANMPIIWLFASRNNILLWVTGWDFGTFNNFHRWVARVATVEAVLHSVGYTIETSLDGLGEYYASWQEEYFYCGAIATTSMCFICLLSLCRMRRYYYEIFLYTHIAFSVILLVGLWYHVKIFDGEYNGYIWPCVAVWSFDRILRVGRILLLNVRFWRTKAKASYCRKSDIIRLDFQGSSGLNKPTPGSFYFIYTFNGLRFWENHPFTISSYTTNDTPSLSPKSNEVELLQGALKPKKDTSSKIDALYTPPRSASVSDRDSLSSKPILSFLIRPLKGSTKRLRDTITRSSSSNSRSSTEIYALIEGPYGHSLPLHRFDNIFFLVGGSGISIATSYITICRNSQPQSCRIDSQNLHITWVIPQTAFFEDVLNNELSSATSDLSKITVDGYITVDQKSDSSHGDVLRNGIANGSVTLRFGRPNVEAVISKAIQDDGLFSIGSSALVVCGPKGMAVEAKVFLFKAMDEHRKMRRVEFFEEYFKW